MGIPSYFSYIIKNHSKILHKLNKNNEKQYQIDNLYLDCNSIIYDAVYSINGKDPVMNMTNLIIQRVIAKIKEYIHQIQPSNTVYIAFDGVAPVAKLDQQRNRRFKSNYQNEMVKQFDNEHIINKWNTCNITPGTPFMETLNTAMYGAFLNPSEFNLHNIIVSGSDQHGEGEHKIFQYIRDNSYTHSSQKTVIYGLDADLIMLSINHIPICPHIFLFRETPAFIQSINAELEPESTYLLDIPELSKTITMDMNQGNTSDKHVCDNYVYDYIFICFFLGNDFMPHFPALNIRTGGIHKMLEAYKATISGTNTNLTDGKKIYWKNVRKLVQFLAENEEEYIKKEHKLRDRKEKNKIQIVNNNDQLNYFINIPTYERSMEKYINPFKEGWQERYYETLFDLQIDDTRRKQISMNILEGLEWTMKYYTTGCCDWRWSYKYNYPPLLTDLVQYIPYFDTELVQNTTENPVSKWVQLCYVLPEDNLHLLPYRLYKEILKYKDKWYSPRPSCEFYWAYCKYFWEAHPNLPDISIPTIEQLLKNI